MSMQAEIAELRSRLDRLERREARSNRGRCNQRKAAEYLGRSREWLRQQHLLGKGPRRGSDGSYAFDDLDAFAEGDTA